MACPICMNKDTNKLDILIIDNEEGFRIDLCNECKSYIKTFERILLNDHTPELLDIMSLPLDIIAQEKGYKRLSPNPIGMIKIS